MLKAVVEMITALSLLLEKAKISMDLDPCRGGEVRVDVHLVDPQQAHVGAGLVQRQRRKRDRSRVLACGFELGGGT